MARTFSVGDVMDKMKEICTKLEDLTNRIEHVAKTTFNTRDRLVDTEKATKVLQTSVADIQSNVEELLERDVVAAVESKEADVVDTVHGRTRKNNMYKIAEWRPAAVIQALISK